MCNNEILIALYLYQHLVISVLLLLTLLVDECLIVVLIVFPGDLLGFSCAYVVFCEVGILTHWKRIEMVFRVK